MKWKSHHERVYPKGSDIFHDTIDVDSDTESYDHRHWRQMAHTQAVQLRLNPKPHVPKANIDNDSD
jgi:hypothetical protein